MAAPRVFKEAGAGRPKQVIHVPQKCFGMTTSDTPENIRLFRILCCN